MARRWLRVREILDAQFLGIVAVLVIVTAAGGWLTYQGHVNLGTTTEQEIVSVWETNGTFTHAAAVSNENPVYDVGTTLRAQPLYLDSITPILNGSFVFQYTASESGALDLRVSQQFRKRKVVERDAGTAEIWQTTTGFGNRTAEDVEPGSTVQIPYAVNVTQARNESQQIDDRLDNPPGELQMSVFTTVTITGTVNGQEISQTREYTMPITLESGGYSVNATGATNQEETTRPVEVPQEPGTLQSVMGPLLFGIGFVGLVGLFAARARNALSLTDAERERLAFEDDRDTYDEWINRIELPGETADLPRAEADSLGDLVDFAIDTNNSVIENPDDGVFFVLHDGYRYAYEPPALDEPEGDQTDRSEPDGADANRGMFTPNELTDGEPDANAPGETSPDDADHSGE
ncbi:DUF5305 domain-containing protein [Haloarcula sp. Atlit-7R]|uniref:DUF5305 domain-containing protein n=1 Tax=Haloarcula sp. Atlit-7R TaxID=2282125 RepID=UPI000EF17576|nr:DUF5305 domain-containing protein [Haloarcula sp. Atlit-7R]RLN01392.1 hypothetical protein D3D01_00820 [Haloarcula sp. Atlit-7R]